MMYWWSKDIGEKKMNSKKAEMGVGTLIIFISLLLVAAVAAGVLIQTAGSLQQRALSTGQAAQAEISSRVLVIDVSAEDGRFDVDNVTVLLRLAPGSNSVRLGDMLVTFSTSNSTQTLEYSNQSSQGNQETFGVSYLIGPTGSVGNLVSGDIIALNFVANSPLTPGEQVRINVIPLRGSNSLVLFTVPDVLSTQRVYLYP